MELLLLLLLIAAVWLMVLPWRVAHTVRRYRMTTAAALTAIALAGLLLLRLGQPAEPPADYAIGDATLRAMLQ
jgi:hypothetical protein